MRIVNRLPSGNPIIDLRLADEAAIVDRSVFAQVREELGFVGGGNNLCVWLIPECASAWVADVDSALALGRAMIAAHQRVRVPISAVLLGRAARDRSLVDLLRGVGIAPFAERTGGGLPIHEVNVSGQRHAVMIPPPLRGRFEENALREGLAEGEEAARAWLEKFIR